MTPYQLTGKKQRPAQVRALRAMGFKINKDFWVRPDGTPVLREGLCGEPRQKQTQPTMRLDFMR